MRSAAMETGAIEGLYVCNRGVTQTGWQDRPLPLGEYKTRPNLSFADGNGRVARTLAFAFLYRSVRLPLVVFADQRKR